MDSTIIEEIARQLGMAVDSASQFITEILPSYALMQSVFGLVAAGVWLLIGIIAIVICIAMRTEEIEEIIDYEWNDATEKRQIRETKRIYKVALFIIIVLLIIFILVSLSDPIRWLLAPDAMFFQMILKTIGG